MILLSLMPPTTLISTPAFFLSYSATSAWNSFSSVPALQPTQTVSFVAVVRSGAADDETAPTVATSTSTRSAITAVALRLMWNLLLGVVWVASALGTPAQVRKLYECESRILVGRCQTTPQRSCFFVRIPTKMATARKARGPAIPPLLKDMNERTVLDAIRAGAPISRAEISRRAGISKPTVSLALQSLLGAGLVREAEHDPERSELRGGRSSSRCRMPRLCSGSTSAHGSPAAPSVISPATSACGRMSSSPAPAPTRRWMQSRSCAGALVDAAGPRRELIDSAVVGVPGVVDDGGRLYLTHFRSLEGSDLGPRSPRGSAFE